MSDYFDVAKREYEWIPYLLKGAHERKDYNLAVTQMQQVAEKYLKGYIDKYLNVCGKYDTQLRTHNLRMLSAIVNEECGVFINIRDAKFLGDYYFDARYPGDNYEVIRDGNTAEECMKICDGIIYVIEKLLKDKDRKGTEFFGKLR